MSAPQISTGPQAAVSGPANHNPPPSYPYNPQPQQPMASTSYTQPHTVPPHQPQTQQYRPPYQQAPTYAPFPQATPLQRPQATTSYYNTSRPWTSYQFPHYPSHGASSYAHTSQPIVYHPPPVVPGGSIQMQTMQRPGYTAMSYQAYGSYPQYTPSGPSSYGQLAQQNVNSTQVSAQNSRASSVMSRHSATPTPHPPSVPTPPPAATVAPPPPAEPILNQSQHAQPVQPAPAPTVPQPPVGTQFRVTTPASFTGQTNELHWQLPYVAPR